MADNNEATVTVANNSESSNPVDYYQSAQPAAIASNAGFSVRYTADEDNSVTGRIIKRSILAYLGMNVANMVFLFILVLLQYILFAKARVYLSLPLLPWVAAFMGLFYKAYVNPDYVLAGVMFQLAGTLYEFGLGIAMSHVNVAAAIFTFLYVAFTIPCLVMGVLVYEKALKDKFESSEQVDLERGKRIHAMVIAWVALSLLRRYDLFNLVVLYAPLRDAIPSGLLAVNILVVIAMSAVDVSQLVVFSFSLIRSKYSTRAPIVFLILNGIMAVVELIISIVLLSLAHKNGNNIDHSAGTFSIAGFFQKIFICCFLVPLALSNRRVNKLTRMYSSVGTPSM